MISEKGLDLIKSFEGYRDKAYEDVIGVWTIGYGTTVVNGVPVKPGMTCTEAEASFWLKDHIENIVDPALRDTLTVQLNQNQLDALYSFIYNVGTGNYKKSTLLKLINQGNHLAAAEQFIRWNKAGGKEVAGLTRRRLAEKLLFLS